jgi:hypothetical protein
VTAVQKAVPWVDQTVRLTADQKAVHSAPRRAQPSAGPMVHRRVG